LLCGDSTVATDVARVLGGVAPHLMVTDPPYGVKASITRQDVTALLDGIANRGSPVQANRTLARLKTLFKWVLDEELIPADPTARVRKVV
jgi:site-specific recombinase XerD